MSISFPDIFKKVFIALIAVTLIYCGDPIPVEEMGNAKFEIARAESVNAENFANEKYEAAKTALFEAHDLVTANKLKEAKEKAIEAQNLAREAFDIAAPKLAEATRAEAEQILAEAEKAYAEEFAKEEYENALNFMATGDEQMGAEEYFDAFQSFESAREEAIKARSLAEAQAEVLAREIVTIEEMIQDAEQYGARDSSPDMLSNAESRLVEARKSLEGMYLKDAYMAIEEARENVTQARDTAKREWATRKKIEANGAVEDAESELVQLKEKLENPDYKKALIESEEGQNTLKMIEESMTAAQESLGNAGDLLDENSFEESYNESEEAIRLSSITKDQMPHLMVLMNELVAKQQTDTTTTTETTTTTTEKIIPDGTTGEAKPVLGEGWKVYTVRLIPERRDCLWRIAEYDYIYGNPYLWSRIYKANKSQIKNPDLIYPGQVFDIPPKSGPVTKPTTPPVTKPQTENNQNNEGTTPTNATNPADNN